MSPSGGASWTLVGWDALTAGQAALLAAAVKPAAIPSDRCLRSATGRLVVIASTPALGRSAGIELSLDPAGADVETIAVLVVDHPGQELDAELRELLAVGGLVALPYGTADRLPADFARRGHLEQVADPELPAVFDVFQLGDDLRRAFTSDAPTDLGEEGGHLEGREDWFRRRQTGPEPD